MNDVLYFFQNNNIPFSWPTLIVGRNFLSLVDAKLVEDYATQYLINNNNNVTNQYILELASGIFDHSYLDEFLAKIANSLNLTIKENTKEWEFEEKKWLFIKLKYLLTQEYSNEELLLKIEDIYCDFDHPKEMYNLIYYNSSEDFSGYSKEACIEQLVHLFKIFLDEQQKLLSTTG